MMQMELKVRALSEQEFAALAPAWAELLENSTADPLFMSWPWLFSWWDVWSESFGLDLLLLGIYDSGNRLVGLAPLYRHDFRTMGGFRIHRVHFIGNAWRVGPSVRTEYVGLIAREGYESEVAALTSGYLRDLNWDEVVVSDSRSPAAGDFGDALTKHDDAIRLVRNESKGICIDTRGRFDAWLQDLGPNTRLKAFNRRSVFEGELEGEVHRIHEDTREYAPFFEQLNSFHHERWGKPCFDDRAVDFHMKLLSRLSGNQRPELTALVVDGRTVSVLYDICSGRGVYNLQAGFDEHLHKKLSPGTLHLGYAVEQAFSDPDIDRYDLLAGYGKNTFYKAKFRGNEVDFTTLEFVRSPMLKLMYQCQAWLPKGMKSRINRLFRL